MPSQGSCQVPGTWQLGVEGQNINHHMGDTGPGLLVPCPDSPPRPNQIVFSVDKSLPWTMSLGFYPVLSSGVKSGCRSLECGMGLGGLGWAWIGLDGLGAISGNPLLAYFQVRVTFLLFPLTYWPPLHTNLSASMLTSPSSTPGHSFSPLPNPCLE